MTTTGTSTAAERAPRSVGRSFVRSPFLWWAIVATLVFHVNGRLVSTGDAYPARVIPLALWLHGTIMLDPVLDVATQHDPTPYWLVTTSGGRTASLFPIPTALVVTPLYAPVVALGSIRGWTPARLTAAAQIMEKVSAVVLTTIAVVLFWAAARRRLAPGGAVLLTAAFAFGTNTWATSSQGLWLHALAEILVVAVILLVTAPPTRMRSILAGAAIATLVTNRPPDIFLAAGLALYALVWWLRGGTRLPFIAAGILAGAPVVVYNVLLFGHPAGAWVGLDPNFFHSQPLFAGIAGLLFSPGRGLFVFSPWLLVLPWALWLSWRDRQHWPLTVCLLAGIVAQLAFYGRTDWRAGHSFGPRYLVDAIPIFAWLCAPAVAALTRIGRAGLAVVVAFSMGVQAVGAFTYNSTSNLIYYANGNDTSALWRLDHTQWWLEGKHPIAEATMDDALRDLLGP